MIPCVLPVDIYGIAARMPVMARVLTAGSYGMSECGVFATRCLTNVSPRDGAKKGLLSQVL
jgi:hypothetical protein